MIRPPPRSTRTDTLFPYTTLFRSGPYALVTGRCVMSFDKAKRRFRLASVHPGHTVEEVRENTGFDFDIPDRVPETEGPDHETLRLIRYEISREIDETYPAFAATVCGIAGQVRQRGVQGKGA